MKRKTLRKFFLLLSVLILLPLILAGVFTTLVYTGSFGPLPDEKELLQIRNSTASVIFDRNEQQIGRIFNINRTAASYDELPEHVIEALIATEDARFLEHEGIDVRSVLRVLVKSLLLGDRNAGGGSTLSQQLAKNLFGRGDYGPLSMAVTKLKEMIIATRMEEVYSKEDLIELYLNTVPFSENVYGIETAAERFFSTQISELSLEKSAVLIGMLKANTYYNPRLYPEHALERRNVVIGQMLRYGYLDEEQYDSLSTLPLGLDYYNLSRDGLASYYLVQVRKEVGRILEESGLDEEYDPRSDGLRIETSLDRRLQRIAESSYQKHLEELQKLFNSHWKGSSAWAKHPEIVQRELQKSRMYRSAKARGLSDTEINDLVKEVSPAMLYYPGGDTVLNISTIDSIAYYLQLLRAGFVALDPQSGAVLSWVGGSDIQFMPFDHVLAKRQAASTFKPIVFTAALEAGIDPCFYWENEKRRYQEYEDWTPENYDNQYGGFYSMSGALKKSVNVAAVQAIFEVGVPEVLELAARMGINSELPTHPSLALGSGSISLLELATAYAVFASGGIHHEAFFVSKISDAEGRVLYQRSASEGKRVISEQTAILMTAMLEKVINDGTGRSLRANYRVKQDLAGKTGTSQNYSDAWFVAYNPNLVAATWVGGIYPIIRFRTGKYGSSSRQALPLVANFYQSVESDRSLQQFQAPFPALPDNLVEDLNCLDYREKNFFDGIKNLFDDKEGQKVPSAEDDKPGFLQRIFGKKKGQ